MDALTRLDVDLEVLTEFVKNHRVQDFEHDPEMKRHFNEMSYHVRRAAGFRDALQMRLGEYKEELKERRESKKRAKEMLKK